MLGEGLREKEGVMSRFLIIDHDSSVRLLLSRIVKHAGHKAYDADDFHRAAKIIPGLGPDFMLVNFYEGLKEQLPIYREIEKNHPKIIKIGLIDNDSESELVYDHASVFDQVFHLPLDWASIFSYVSNCEKVHVKTLKRILIVDDNRAIHEDFKRILRTRSEKSYEKLDELAKEVFQNIPKYQQGTEYKLLSAYSAEDSIEVVRSHYENGGQIDAVIMDVRMPPGMDGIKATKKIREINPDQELIICSAYSDYTEEMIRAEIEGKPLHFLKKPFISENAMDLIRSIFYGDFQSA